MTTTISPSASSRPAIQDAPMAAGPTRTTPRSAPLRGSTRPGPAGARGTALTTALALLAMLAFAVLAWRTWRLESHLREQLATLGDRSERVERTLQLLRVEAASGRGGVAGVLEQIEHWAPQLSSAATNAALAIEIQRRLTEIASTAPELDPETAFEQLEAGFAANEDPEVRRWILRVMLRAAPERGRDFCQKIVRGTAHQPDPSTRLRAADELIDVDPQLAGQVIKDVLEFESSRGLRSQLPVNRAQEYEQYVRGEQFPMYFNFIGRFVRTGHEDVVPVLTSILMRDDHDRMTYMQCIEELGKLGAEQAVRRIESLFERPPFAFRDPLFMRTCLNALVAIQGRGARPFLEAELSKQQEPLVMSTLETLIKQLDT